jgi:phage tail-like protein
VPEFSVNPERLDPYKHFKFRVKWDGRYVAGVSRVSALRRVTDVVVHRDGADPSSARRSPGLTAFDPIVLERGRTHDLEFEQWASKVWRLGAALGAEVSLRDFRKDVRIELYNEAGQLVMAFVVFRCWPSEYVALGPLDGGRSVTAFESLTLQHEGWQRDADVAEPTEPSLAD